MKRLSLVLLVSGILACCCTTKPLSMTPYSPENRLVDSCEVFLRKLRANMIFDGDNTASPHYYVGGDWAKRSRKHPRLFNIAADFIDYKSCIIGLTPNELRGWIGRPYVDPDGTRYIYGYTRKDTTSVHTAGLYRHGCIVIILHDTIRNVSYWGDCIRID